MTSFRFAPRAFSTLLRLAPGPSSTSFRSVLRPRLLLFLLPVLLCSCSGRRLAETLFLGDHYAHTRNLAFGGQGLKLDIYAPKAARTPGSAPAVQVRSGSSPEARPVLVFIHGGRWREGSKDQYRLLGNAFTGRGWVAVIPDIRPFPTAPFPGWVEDAAQSIRWTKDHIARFGGDSSRITVIGHSSGAHTVALLALDSGYLRRAGLGRDAVQGFIALAGPVATEWTDPDVQEAMGPRAGWPATYPVRLADGTAPPLLLLHGGNDKTVHPANSTRLAAAITGRGGCARAVVYPKLSHVGILAAIAVPPLRRTPVLDTIAAFVRHAPGKACPSP